MLPWFVFEEVMEFIWEQFELVADTIMDNPLLLLPFGVAFFGTMITVTKKFFSFKS